MFLMTDDKQLINTKFIMTIKIEGLTLKFISSAGEVLGVKTLKDEKDLDSTLEYLQVSPEARAIDRVAFQLEDIENMIENICIQLHKDM